jgi:tRNA-specific 2-thiouridylase
VGTHGGVHRFTVGQRKGLGVTLGSPAYVVGIDAEHAAVKLGAADELLSSGARLDGATFYDDVELPVRALVQVRYRHTPVLATMTRDDRGVAVHFDEPVRAVVRGQVAVAYAGDRVLGGGTIKEAIA